MLQLGRIEHDHDGALIPSERRRRGNPGQSREQRAHAVDRIILHLALRVRGAAEDQQAHGHAARVEPRDERRHGPRRHESARAVHVANRFRHRLTHVGVLMEHQLHQGGALDALAFHVVDAGDVEEVILVVVSQVAFHLGRVHAAVRLRDVDGRIADLRKDIDRHAADCENGAQRNGDQRHHHGERPAQRG